MVVRPLEQVAPLARPLPDLSDPEKGLARVRAVLRRIEGEIAPLRPEGAVDLRNISTEQYRYFAVREHLDAIRDAERRLAERVEEGAEVAYTVAGLPPRGRRAVGRACAATTSAVGAVLREMAAALDITEYLRELAQAAASPFNDSLSRDLLSLARRTALAALVADGLRTPTAERVAVWVHGGGQEREAGLRQWIGAAFTDLGLDVADKSAFMELHGGVARCLLAQGLHALPIAHLEAGVHLFCPPHAAMELLEIEIIPLADGMEALDAVSARLRDRKMWREALRRGDAGTATDPNPPGSVVRIYDWPGQGEDESSVRCIDLRTGMTGGKSDLSACLLAALPLPPEFEVA